MRANTIIVVLLVVGLATLTTSAPPAPLLQRQQQAQVPAQVNNNKTLALVTLQLSNANDTLETAPSAITSVHHHQQVWTSSSSGSLDELSPEMISKLRNDVPFLAAYALRPRLVGGGTGSGASPATVTSTQQVVEHLVPARPEIKLETSSSEGSPLVVRQSRAQLQLANSNKLPDFSELNVETSSLSKSEHRHKRKTSLKRSAQSPPPPPEFAGRLKTSSKKRAASRRSLRRSASGRLRAASQQATPINRRRQSQRQSTSSAIDNDDDENSVDVKRELNNATELARDSNGVKGGGGPSKRPFYASKRPIEDTPTDDREASGMGRGKMIDDGDETTNDLDEEDQLDEALPKRVGDDDLDPEGDTELVEPKSDGIDDDPPLPDEPEEGVAGEPKPVDDQDDQDSQGKPEGDPRGNRNDRDKPNDAGDGQVATGGGGIGATVGGAGSPAGRGAGDDSGSSVEFAKDDDKDKDKNDDDDVDRERPKSSTGSGGGSQQGVGGVGGDFGDRKQLSGGRKSEHDDGDDSVGAKDADRDVDYRDEMDEVERKRGGRPAGSSGDGGDHQLEGDKDFNDSHKPKVTSGGGHHDADQHSKNHHEGDHCDDQHHHHHDTIEWLRGAIPGEPEADYPVLSRVNSTNFKCAQQKHAGYYADVESRCQIFHICQADGRQDSFLCPNGTIFSQKTLVCVWWNGFQCEDAPKFYHLNELLYKSTSGSASPQTLALPGSSLRPRGDASTPSSISNNGDDADDADESIEGLVKRMRGRRPQAASDSADGSDAQLPPPSRGGAKAPPSPSLANGGPKTTPSKAHNDDDNDEDYENDEPTIQRKQSSTKFANDNIGLPETDAAPARSPSSASSSSRVRARDNTPRRKRRASVRQAPPKLKSRRVSRNSRRRKLRHGIKPRRRA